MDPSEAASMEKARERAVIEAYRPVCLCHKIPRKTIMRAIQAGASTFEMVRRRTGAGTGPCGSARCGPMIKGMLGEDVETCVACGWAMLKSLPPVCPRCGHIHSPR